MFRRMCIIFLALFLIFGFASASEEKNSLIDYGSGVIFFYNAHEAYPGTGFRDTYQEFGNALSQYLSIHPEKRVTSMVADGSAGYGATRGFYVTVENKTPTFRLGMN